MKSLSRKRCFLLVICAFLILGAIWFVPKEQSLTDRIGVAYVGVGYHEFKTGWWFTLTNLTEKPVEVKARVQQSEILIRKEIGGRSVRTNFFVPQPITDLEHLAVHFTIPDHRPPFNPLEIAILRTWGYLDAMLGRTRLPVTNEAIVVTVPRIPTE